MSLPSHPLDPPRESGAARRAERSSGASGAPSGGSAPVGRADNRISGRTSERVGAGTDRPSSGVGHSSARDLASAVSGPDDITRAASSSGSTPAREIDDGQPRIAGYVLHEELHRGGQGIVYRALQIGTKREVALKVLLEGPFASADARLRFEREIELAASLKHPHIVTILDSGLSHGRCYFAMEYVHGQRLNQHVRSTDPPLDKLLALFERICTAVNFAHQRGVIHRDLKPSNILVDSEGNPHVLDFGLAKPIQTPDSRDTTIHLISTAGQVLGTVAYMSPEQAANPQNVDVRSDVYSLGVIFYEILMGQHPYPVSGTLADVLRHIADTEPASPRGLRRQTAPGRAVDDELGTILLRALEKEPARRYQTAGDLGRDLRHYIDGDPIEAKRASGLYMLRKTLRRYRVHATVALVMLMMLIGGLFGFAWMYRRESALRADADAASVRADEARKLADQKARAEEIARNNAETIAQQLREAVVAGAIQRGDLARERGDLALARDGYWEAYGDTPTPAARWNLRRYFVETGEIDSHQLYVGPSETAAVSPDGTLAAVITQPTGIAVHDVRGGRGVGFYVTPQPPTCLRIGDSGLVTAAGRGWARLFALGSVRPAAVLELPTAFVPDDAFVDEGDGRVYLCDAQTVLVCPTRTSGPMVRLNLHAVRSGPADFSTALHALAVPTAAGVELIGPDADGRVAGQIIWKRTAAAARAVRFSGEDLLAVLSNVVDMVRLGGEQHGNVLRFLEPPDTWDMFDLRSGVGVIVLGSFDGRVALYRSGSLYRAWQVTHGGLLDVHFGTDEETLVTRDGRGTLTHWTATAGSAQRVPIASRPAVEWHVSDDSSTAALLGEDGAVLAYRPAADAQPKVIVAGSTSAAPAGAAWANSVSLSLSSDGSRLLLRQASRLSLYDTADATVKWSTTWEDHESPTPRQALLSPDAAQVAVWTDSLSGDQQRIARFAPGRSGLQPATGGGDPRDQRRFERVGTALTVTGSPIRGLTFVPGTRTLLVSRANGELGLIDENGDRLVTWTTLESPALRMDFDAAGKRLAVASDDRVVRVFDFGTARLLLRLNIAQPVSGVDFHPEAELLGVRSTDGAVRLFDLSDGELVARWTLEGGGQRPLAAWIGAADAALLAYDGRVFEHRFGVTDLLIRANRRYPLQRSIVSALDEGNYEKAWANAARLAEIDPSAGGLARQEIVELLLARLNQPVSQAWIAAATGESQPGAAVPQQPGAAAVHGEPAGGGRATQPGAAVPQQPGAAGVQQPGAVVVQQPDVPATLRLAHAAYKGRRFDVARGLFQQAAGLLGADLDAYSLWRIAQCDYLEQEYSAAARTLAALPQRDDFDALDIPRAQLELTAALLMGGQTRPAKRMGLQIGQTIRSMQRSYVVTTGSAQAIGRHLAGVTRESLVTSYFSSLLTAFAEGSLDYHDDPFFFGELARLRGEDGGAILQYQRCIETARDDWPSNWARYRIEQLRRKGGDQ